MKRLPERGKGRRILTLAWTSLALAGPALGQPYAIDWYATPGGGGTSTGGAYELSGSIGQAAAGNLAGGTYTVTGGYWAIAECVNRALTVADALPVTEGNAGTVQVVFSVSLSGPPTCRITVSYATTAGSAAADVDYTTTNGTLIFDPGQPTSQDVPVPALGDTLSEIDETFTLDLSGPVGGTIGDGTGVGTIDDDDPLASLLIGNASLKEGNAGATDMVFTITLSPASGQTVSVAYATSPGTATAGTDYTTTSATATFLPGETTKPVAVPVLGDTLNERPEAFSVTLGSESGATIGSGTGQGTIVDDEDKIVQFDPDTLSDLAVFHPASALWFMKNSTDGAVSSIGFGGAGYTRVPGDYDGDGITDVAVYHPPSGLWFIRNSTTGTTTSLGFGGTSYAPVRGDFDGDSKTDIAVFHDPTGLWFIRNSSTGTVTTVGYGGSGYVPVPADYDGDGTTDLGVYHPPSGLWFTRASSTLLTTTTGFGGSAYAPVRGDFDGDGKTDHAVFHSASGIWYLRYSATSTVEAIGYGGSGYAPVPGKYDADGKADLAVYHEPSGLWFMRSSLGGGSSSAIGFGATGYLPVN